MCQRAKTTSPTIARKFCGFSVHGGAAVVVYSTYIFQILQAMDDYSFCISLSPLDASTRAEQFRLRRIDCSAFRLLLVGERAELLSARSNGYLTTLIHGPSTEIA